MRIVGGRHRGRKLAAPRGRDVRPTADRTRESLFNILEHGHFVEGGGSPLRGVAVLDAFAGTGALGLEALSRGARRAVFMETEREALDVLTHNVAACREQDHAEVLRFDATHPPPPREACALAFLDPPYGSGLAGPALRALAATGWLEPGAICCVELAAGEAFTPPDGFTVVDERRYGAARIVLLRYGDTGTGLRR